MTKNQPKPAPPYSLLPLLPTRELIVFPKMVAPLFVGREKSVKAIEQAFADKTPLLLSSQREPLVEEPEADDILAVGTVATVLQLFKLPDGSVKALVEGQERARIDSFAATSPHFIAAYTPLATEGSGSVRSRSLARRVVAEFATYVEMSPHLADEVQYVVAQTEDPGEIADIVAAHLLISTSEKQALLEMVSTEKRLLTLIESLAEENAVLGIEQEIAAKVQERIGGAQRQMLLHEKMHVIREEIEAAGENSDEGVEEYVTRARGCALSPAAATLVEKEVRKLKLAPPLSAEVSVIRGFLDTVLDLPWGKTVATQVDIAAVANYLDRSHYGLKDVKDRVLEYLAVCQLLGTDQPNTIMCLAGPPGTGKSSVARAIAAALGRPFIRVALGGVHDEAEIRGHRRTYVGAMPGRIVDALIKSGVDNPVILLDEIDKMESDFRGNPAAALMEVLDPTQNAHFRDNYLEIDYDLSKVFFIATANDLDGIPATLYDRLEMIMLSGYTLQEKVAIARRHLIPRTAMETGLAAADVRVAAPVVRSIVRGHTREAGVRDLERNLRRIYRKVARRHLEEGLALPITVGDADLHGYLGEAHWLDTELPRAQQVGASLGLAYTSDGGDVLTIEATIVKGRGELLLTGQLGEVMQESGSAAWAYILSHVERDPLLRPLLAHSPYKQHGKALNLSTFDVRVHVPEGAIPKDGPSAGLPLAAAMLSALTAVPLRPRVAMTGEITLAGRALRVGGLKEKCLAATRLGVRTVVLPEGNRASVRELPDEVTGKLEFVYVKQFSDALEHIFAQGKR
ncbi:MAG: endopeptidase La [Thermoleophilia bacterium]